MADLPQLNQAMNLLGQILPLTSRVIVRIKNLSQYYTKDLVPGGSLLVRQLEHHLGEGFVELMQLLAEYYSNFVVGEALHVHENLPFPIVYIDEVSRVERFQAIVPALEGLDNLFMAARNGNVAENYHSPQLLQSLVNVVNLMNADLQAVVNGLEDNNALNDDGLEEGDLLAIMNDAGLDGENENNHLMNDNELEDANVVAAGNAGGFNGVEHNNDPVGNNGLEDVNVVAAENAGGFNGAGNNDDPVGNNGLGEVNVAAAGDAGVGLAMFVPEGGYDGYLLGGSGLDDGADDHNIGEILNDMSEQIGQQDPPLLEDDHMNDKEFAKTAVLARLTEIQEAVNEGRQQHSVALEALQISGVRCPAAEEALRISGVKLGEANEAMINLQEQMKTLFL